MTDWHPILAAVEDAPGFWRLVGQYDRTYGLIRLVRRQAHLCYRAEVIPRPGDEPIFVGYFQSLRQSAQEVHMKSLHGRTPQRPDIAAGRPGMPKSSPASRS